MLNEYPLSTQLTLKNKIVMAPMTRVQANDDFVPTPAMADYYARRAEAGLIVTEGTIISADGRGHNNVPGIFNQAHVHHWQHVTDAVHHRDGLIFLQIWHVGRVSHPYFLQGALPVSASKTEMTGRLSRMQNLNYGKSRAATLADIKILINQYADAAANAIKAGFDGIEIHGANGYLIDQFLHYDTNKREDDYGGTPEKMARFALEVVKACGDMIGYERVGLRLSPGAYLNEIKGDKRDEAVFKYLLTQLNSLNIAYVHTGSFDDTKTYAELSDKTMTAFIRTHYRGTVIASGGYTPEKAQLGIENGDFNLAAIGRPFIANPDLMLRIRAAQSLQAYDAGMLTTLY